MRLGSLQLPSRFMLSPLERVSSVGFRELAFQQGAGLTWTPMVRRHQAKQYSLACQVRAKSVAAEHPETLNAVDTHDPATPTGVQLLASNSTELDRALEVLKRGAAGKHPHWSNIW